MPDRRSAAADQPLPVIWVVTVSRLSRLVHDVTPEFDARARIETIHLGFEEAARELRRRLERVLMLQADVTANRPEHLALLKRFRLYGPPGIIFFDREGREIEGLRVVGFQPPPEFATVLDRALRVR